MLASRWRSHLVGLVRMKGELIYTFTPNPALDVGGTVDRLRPDEKNYVFDETRSAGGNGINAARIAHRLGAKVIVSGFLGGSVGKEFQKLLDEEGIRHRFVYTAKNTRINLTVSNRDSHTQTRLSFPGPEIGAAELRKFNHFFRKLKTPSVVVLGGSLPNGVSSESICTLVERLNKERVPCLVDMPGSVLKKIISAEPFFIKPNLLEFQNLVGKNVRTIRSAVPLARQLTKHVKMICISSIERGAVLVTKNRAWFGRIPRVKVRATLGAGDSMVGAISAELSKGGIKNMDSGSVDAYLEENGCELLRWGLAAACATLARSGMRFGDKRSIIRYYREIHVHDLAGKVL